MKIRIIISLSLVGILSVAAFQTGKSITDQKDKIKQTVNLKNGNVSDYTYTPSGHIAMIKTSKGVSSTYEYTDRMVVKRLNDPLAKTSTLDSLIFNSKGQVAKIYETIKASSQMIPQQCEYDADGHLLVSKYEYKGTELSRDEATFKDGNKIIQKKSLGDDPGKPHLLYFTYYTDRHNTINDDNMGMEFMGKGSINPIKMILSISPYKDTSRTYFYYHYDDHGRISIKASYFLSKLMDSIQYNYY